MRGLKEIMISPITGRCRLKLARFLVEMFAEKPEDADWLGIDFEYDNKIYRFMIKEYKEDLKLEMIKNE